MGQFSWLCSVCGEQILNNSKHEDHNQAILVTPKGKHIEPDYEGYGVFGGVDAFTWLACEFNNEDVINEDHKDNEEMRQFGIRLEHSELVTVNKGIRLVHRCCYEGQGYDELANSENDPNQGWLYEDEEEDGDIW